MTSCKPQVDEQVADPLLALQVGVAGLRRQLVGQQRRRQAVVAVDAGQVLDQVGGPAWMSSRCGGVVTSQRVRLRPARP